jgi:hypothetical protein
MVGGIAGGPLAVAEQFPDPPTDGISADGRPVAQRLRRDRDHQEQYFPHYTRKLRTVTPGLEKAIEIRADAKPLRRLHASDAEIARGEAEAQEDLNATIQRRPRRDLTVVEGTRRRCAYRP